MRSARLTEFFVVAFLMCCSSFSFAENGILDSITIIELRSDRGMAVVQLGDGKKQKLKIGEAIPGTHAGVVQVLPDKLVIEDVVEKEDYLAKQTVLIHKPKSPGEKSEIQRLEHQGYTRKALHLPKNERHQKDSQ